MSVCSVQDLQKIVSVPRNGANGLFRHAFNKAFLYSDGVQEMAQLAQAFWLLDILALRLEPVFAKAWGSGEVGVGVVLLEVFESPQDGVKARVRLLGDTSDASDLAQVTVPMTDFPPGEWQLFLGRDQMDDKGAMATTCILPTEY